MDEDEASRLASSCLSTAGKQLCANRVETAGGAAAVSVSRLLRGTVVGATVACLNPLLLPSFPPDFTKRLDEVP
jgi:hypothetical protein